MSNTGKKLSPCHEISHDSRPRYVKRLNFGQRLETNLKTRQQPCQSRLEISNDNKDDDLLTLNKELYVNQWLQKHEDKFVEENNLIYPISPVLSSSISSVTKRTPGSPILGSSTKRPRRGYTQNNSSRKENLNLDVDRLKSKNGSLSSSVLSNQTQQSSSRVQEKSEKENLRQILFSPSTSLSSYVNKSPILSGKVRSRRFRQKRLFDASLKLKNSVNSEKTLKLENEVIPSVSVNVSTLDKKSNSFNIIDDDTFFEKEDITEPLIKEEEIEDVEETFFKKGDITEPLIKEEEIEDVDLLQSQEIFDAKIENESSIKENLLVETNKSDEFKDDEGTFIDDKTDSDKTVSDFIEDNDTEEVIFEKIVTKDSNIVEEKLPVPCKSSSKDLDETFFSKGENCRSQILQPSQMISQVSSSKIIADSFSQIINVTSAETSSQKPVAEPFISMLKTEKKKRKVKKGSLVAKLKTLISREISFMRMWQHQSSQPAFQNINVQFIHLCIKRSFISYSRQFTECFLIADAFNLLEKTSNLQTQQDASSQSVNSRRKITIMTIPDVVGELKAEKGKCMKVFHPWEILDQENLTLSVTYFIIDDKVNLEFENEESIEPVKNIRTESFDCPCIREGKYFENCSFKYDERKPNVIQDIFSTS